jgi:hypothetical protein
MELQIAAMMFHWTWTEVGQLAAMLVIVSGLILAGAYGIKRL